MKFYSCSDKQDDYKDYVHIIFAEDMTLAFKNRCETLSELLNDIVDDIDIIDFDFYDRFYLRVFNLYKHMKRYTSK